MPEEGIWKEVEGYRFRYQVNESGAVRKQLEDGSWFYLRPYVAGRNRACVKMRTADNRKVDVPVVWLVADAFMGGRRPGMNILHKNGAKMDCAVWNLKFVTKRESGKVSSGNRRKAVAKIDRKGNVVEMYSSGREAAKKNYISQNSIWARCRNKVQDPFSIDGFNYQYV